MLDSRACLTITYLHLQTGHSQDADMQPEAAERRYGTRASNNPHPAVPWGLRKRTMNEIRKDASVKRAEKEAQERIVTQAQQELREKEAQGAKKLAALEDAHMREQQAEEEYLEEQGSLVFRTTGSRARRANQSSNDNREDARDDNSNEAGERGELDDDVREMVSDSDHEAEHEAEKPKVSAHTSSHPRRLTRAF